MNLAKLFRWNKPEVTNTELLIDTNKIQTNSNVVALPVSTDSVEAKENSLDLPQTPKLNL